MFKLRKWGPAVLGLTLILVGAGLGLFLWAQSVQAAAAQQPVYAIPQPVDFPAPGIALLSLAGEPVKLSDYLGQVILVNNWATWCPPCKQEMPDLQAYYELHQAQGLVLVAVNASESQAEVAAFVTEYQLTFPVWLDPHDRMLRVLGNNRLPNSFVVDRQGVVKLAWTGPISLEILEKYITPFLEE